MFVEQKTITNAPICTSKSDTSIIECCNQKGTSYSTSNFATTVLSFGNLLRLPEKSLPQLNAMELHRHCSRLLYIYENNFKIRKRRMMQLAKSFSLFPSKTFANQNQSNQRSCMLGSESTSSPFVSIHQSPFSCNISPIGPTQNKIERVHEVDSKINEKDSSIHSLSDTECLDIKRRQRAFMDAMEEAATETSPSRGDECNTFMEQFSASSTPVTGHRGARFFHEARNLGLDDPSMQYEYYRCMQGEHSAKKQ